MKVKIEYFKQLADTLIQLYKQGILKRKTF